MTIHLAHRQILAQLYEIYDNREAANIADMVIEHVTGQPKIERIIYKDLPVSREQQVQLEHIIAELLKHRPVQYVLGEAWFMDMQLLVTEAVLIPRPETEELVQWIITDLKAKEVAELSLLDVGTGSGCIPIALGKAIKRTIISAIDVSEQALKVATSNAARQGVSINFARLNFLNENEWRQLGNYDVVISNPPYVKYSEKSNMSDNVLLYEPAIALFVEDNDPLQFYKAIAKFSSTHLKPGGNMYVEINEALGIEVEQLFTNTDFVEVSIRKDLQGKDRMIKASTPSKQQPD